MNKRNSKKSILYSCLILILVLLMIISGLQILESTVFHNNQGTEPTIASKTIIRNGVKYYPRKDITVLLVIGVDQFGVVEDSGSYNNDGAADMVSLLIFDETNRECRILSLNRDTMLNMSILGIGGKKAGTAYQQLALSHTYGSGLEDSCENTKEAVSNFLYGLHIDYYLSMNMDAITTLNDAVGGVTVTVKDDFSEVDPTITMGEVKLMGQQAINFVRTRKGVADQLNISRMERQREYMHGFVKALQKKKDDTSFALTTYDAVSDYIVTDCSSTVLNNMLQRYADYPIVELVSPEGENVMADYYEFHVDEEKLDELILRLFYAPK